MVRNTVASGSQRKRNLSIDTDGAESPTKKRIIVNDTTVHVRATKKATPLWHCDKCLKVIREVRYTCSTCIGYNWCKKCYDDSDKRDLPHAFTNCDDPVAAFLQSRSKRPAATSAPHELAPAPQQLNPASSAGANSASHSFYNEKSVAELKAYLRENNVDYADNSDRETLSRRVWDTRVEHMTIPEVDTFLMENNISTLDCGDLESRRRKVKNTFDFQRLHQNDVVMFTNLEGADIVLNGKLAKVVQPDCGGGKAEVCFKVKVNLDKLLVRSDLKSDKY